MVGTLHIVVAMKPATGSFVENATEHGVAGFHIDGIRIPVVDAEYAKNCSGDRGHADNRTRDLDFGMGCGKASDVGRWPTNVILCHLSGCQKDKCEDGCPASIMDKQSGIRLGMSGGGATDRNKKSGWRIQPFNRKLVQDTWLRGDSGGASRFFKRVKV